MTMTQLVLPGFLDAATTCPRCGHRFVPERATAESISPVALTIWDGLRTGRLRGPVLQVRTVARQVGYSPAQAQRGLVELAAKGYITRVQRGSRSMYRRKAANG